MWGPMSVNTPAESPAGILPPSPGPQVRRTPGREEFMERSGWTSWGAGQTHAPGTVRGSACVFTACLFLGKIIGYSAVIWVATFGDVSLRFH